LNGRELEDIEGVGPKTARKLKECGVYTAQDLAASDPNELIKDGVTDSRDTANDLIVGATKLLNDTEDDGFKTALSDMQVRDKDVRFLLTGSKALDKLMSGGVETGSVTEFYGEFGSGKSQLCHTLAVLAQRPATEGGFDSDVIYIDTEGTFRPHRVREIIKRRWPELTDEQVFAMMKRIHLARVYNTERLMHYIKTAGKAIIDHNVGLLIIDSLTNLHRNEFVGRGQLSERQQKLNVLMHRLVRIAEYFKIAVVFTNQVMASPDTFFGDPIKASGGNVVAHGSTYRIYLRKSGANKLATFIDSPCHAYDQARFTVTAKGVEDMEEKPKKKDILAEEQTPEQPAS
jgi:DNA repair protein RadA